MTADLWVLACARSFARVAFQQRRHAVEIGLERVEVEHQRRGVDLLLAHPGFGGRGLLHRDLLGAWQRIGGSSLAATAARRNPA